MKKQICIFSEFKNSQRGGMMIELLLTIALAAVMLPFVVNFQKDRITRAENIALQKNMETVRFALEKYIDINKKDLTTTVGRNITRVKISDLEEYGAPTNFIATQGDNLQVRIVKSNDRNGHITIHGVVVLNDKDISALRTREIINLGGDNMGFVENGRAFGAFGTWNTRAGILGVTGDNGIIEVTDTKMDSEKYLWRKPSENASDSTMLSALNLGKHNIINTKFMDSTTARFDEILKSEKIVSDKIVFQNRTMIDKNYHTTEAVVAGTLSSDSRSMEISNTLNLVGAAKLSGFTSDNLWTNTLTLSGISISAHDGKPAILKVNQTIDMVKGHVTASIINVGFTGSITPKLVVKSRIEDASNPSYFWDISGRSARFSDTSFVELNRMAILSSRKEAGSKTTATQLFSTVATNKNATAADFMNAITEIQKRVRSKYRLLNIE